MIITTISKIKKIILSAFVATILLLGSGYLLLEQGIEIRHVTLPWIEIEQLYLRVDKKLIVQAQKVSLAKRNMSTAFSFAPIEYIPKYFQKIDIAQLDYEGIPITIHYEKSRLLCSSDSFEASLLFGYRDETLYLKIERLFFKPYNLTLRGVGKFTPRSIFFAGSYDIEGIEGKLKVEKEGEVVTFFASSKPFTNDKLAKLFSHLTLHPLIKAWSYEKIRAKRYRLAYCKARVDLAKGFDPNGIEALALAEDVDVTFHPDLPPATIKKVALRYSNDRLIFKLTRPTYQGYDLKGSRVVIYNITKPGSFIRITIHTVAPLRKKIHRVLRAYDIDLPITQKRGVTDARLTITIRFKDGKIGVKGRFKTANTTLSIKGIDLKVDRAVVTLHNKKATIHPSRIAIEPLLSAEVEGVVEPKGATLKAHILQAKVQVQDKTLLQAKNLDERVEIDFEKSAIRLKKMGIIVTIEPKKEIVIPNILSLRPYSALLQKLPIKEGNLTVWLEPLLYRSILKIEDSPFLQNDRPIEKLSIRGDRKRATINDFLSVRFMPLQLKLHNITIDTTKLPKANTQEGENFTITLKHCTLLKHKHKLLVDWGTIQRNGDWLTFDMGYDGGEAHFRMQKEHFELHAQRLDATFIKALFGISFVQGGRFDFEAKGGLDQFEGVLTIHHGYIKDLTTLNNVLAFINTIPAIVTLSDPGFSTHGMPIKSGKIHFTFKDGIIYVTSLHIISGSLEFRGSGVIDTIGKKIAMQMQLGSLKSVANIISKIPIAGYILLGKDGTISTSFSITGDLDNPKVTTHMTKDVIKMPFGIIKRTFELPFKIFQ